MYLEIRISLVTSMKSWANFG